MHIVVITILIIMMMIILIIIIIINIIIVIMILLYFYYYYCSYYNNEQQATDYEDNSGAVENYFVPEINEKNPPNRAFHTAHIAQHHTTPPLTHRKYDKHYKHTT